MVSKERLSHFLVRVKGVLEEQKIKKEKQSSNKNWGKKYSIEKTGKVLSYRKIREIRFEEYRGKWDPVYPYISAN
jgi:hypothetical protein